MMSGPHQVDTGKAPRNTPAGESAEDRPGVRAPWYGRSSAPEALLLEDSAWPSREHSRDPEVLLGRLLAVEATQVAFEMSPVLWRYFVLDCQRVLRHLQAERQRLLDRARAVENS
jgi:hypothetical protein